MVNFDEMYRRCAAILAASDRPAANSEALQQQRQELLLLQGDIAALREAERGNGVRRKFRDYIFELFTDTLESNGIRQGVIAEVGGSKNSFLHKLPGFEARFLSMMPLPDERAVVADITNCPHIPDASFDAIFSISVLEHVTHIHDAGREITRLLRPGGITMHAVPFSYFFHGAPVDYWRVTTTALQSIFEELETIDCFFYSDNRRRNNLGSAVNPVDQDGGPMFAPDAFGGWRENWFTIYIGRKLPDGAERLRQKRQQQMLIDLLKGLLESGTAEHEAVELTRRLSRYVSFDPHGRTLVSSTPVATEPALDARTLADLWAKRGRKTIRPGIARHNLLAMLSAAGLLG